MNKTYAIILLISVGVSNIYAQIVPPDHPCASYWNRPRSKDEASGLCGCCHTNACSCSICDNWKSNKELKQKQQEESRQRQAEQNRPNPSRESNSNNGFANNNNLNYPGTPEQQRVAQQRQLAEQQRQQAEFQRQQQNQQIGSVMNNMLGNMAVGGQQTANEFNRKMAANRDKVDAINNQSNQNQPKDDKGIMDAARRGNLSTEDLGPGQEADEDDKKLLAEPETKRLVGLSDTQFEAERQRFMERNKDRPNGDATPDYSGGTSRLAESEREIQHRQTENAPNRVTSGSDQSTTVPNKSDEETIADNMRNFAQRIKEKGFNWASFTDEEKAQAAYMGYMAMNVAQSVAGNFLYMYGGGVGALYGFTLGADAVNDAMRIQNPFLNTRVKK